MSDLDLDACDSCEEDLELQGETRGDAMCELEWKIYTGDKMNVWRQSRDRFATYDEAKKQAKR